jgi:hypothetical protein
MARYRCPQCRTRRTSWVSMLKHMADKDHRAHHCAGYWFPHRCGGGACEESPKAEYYSLLRQGASKAEAEQTLAVHVLERMP